MSKSNKLKIIYAFLVLLVILGVVYFKFYRSPNVQAETHGPCDKANSTYEINNCFSDLLDKKDKELDSLVKELSDISKTNITKAKIEYPESGVWGADQSFLDNLTALYPKWKVYRDALCDTQEADSWGGSGQSGFITECRIDEDNLFLTHLNDFKTTWSRSN